MNHASDTGPPLLSRDFFAQPAEIVARELIGKQIHANDVVLRITETEAYVGPHDTACHARSGKTARNAAIFGPPGLLYVYLCYGIHHLLNVSTDAEGFGAAVLVRAAEPLEGIEVLQRRRGGQSGVRLTTGPGCVGQALAVDTSWSFHDATRPGGLEMREAADDVPQPQLLCGPRVGIDYASPEDIEAPLRFALAGSPYVTAKRALRAWEPPR